MSAVSASAGTDAAGSVSVPSSPCCWAAAAEVPDGMSFFAISDGDRLLPRERAGVGVADVGEDPGGAEYGQQHRQCDG